MAETFVQFTRTEFENWLESLPYKWYIKPHTGGVYILILSDSVGVEISSTLTGRDDVVSKAEASMSVKLVSRVTGQTLNKKAVGQSHFKRTMNWAKNLGQGVKDVVNAYKSAESFYEARAVIADMEQYKRKYMDIITQRQNWQSDSFLSSLYDRLRDGGILSVNQIKALEKPTLTKTVAPVDPKYMGQIRALYGIAKQDDNAWLMGFTETVAKNLQAGIQLTEKQSLTLDREIRINSDAIQRILAKSPNLIRASVSRVAIRHLTM